MSFSLTKEYFHRVALGEVANCSIVNKFGRNGDVDAAEDVCGSGGDYAGMPAAFTAETLQCLSTSTNDTSAGTGARTVKAMALTTGGVWTQITFTLNGTTPVAPDSPYNATTFTRCHTAYVDTAGSGGANAGDITIRHSTTTANVFITLLAGRNQSNEAVYTIPSGYVGLVVSANFSIFNAANQLASTEISFAIREQNKLWRFRRPQEVNNFAGAAYTDITGGTLLQPYTDIKMRVLSVTHANTVVCAAFDVYLQPTEVLPP